MTEAFLNHLGRGMVEAESGGTMPSDCLNPVVVQVMKEKGIDLSRKKPKLLRQEIVDRADRVITMGCSIGETCPAAPMAVEDWGLEDPQGKSIQEIRKIRDQIEAKVRQLLSEVDDASVFATR